jgi:hypothetical protein
MAAAAKVAFGLDMLVAPEFEQLKQQPVRQSRSFRSARGKTPHNAKSLRTAAAKNQF